MRALLHRVLAGDDASSPSGPSGPEAWWQRHRLAAAAFDLPVDRAIAGGAAAASLGEAFGSGYHEALRALVPSLPRDELVALCATEAGGAHPKAIEARLTASDAGLRLSGHKQWSTMAPLAARLLVLAVEGEREGRKALRLVQVRREAAGVTVRPMPPTPFAPEIPHAEVDLDAVAVAEADVLPGDGWERYVRPFRTVEDCHVLAALLGFVSATARRHRWPDTALARLVSALAGVRALALEDPTAPEVHVAVAGTLAQTRALLDELEPHWALSPAEVRASWERDRPLLEVAGNARQARTAKAWERIRA